jgi:hypothetical protein
MSMFSNCLVYICKDTDFYKIRGGKKGKPYKIRGGKRVEPYKIRGGKRD